VKRFLGTQAQTSRVNTINYSAIFDLALQKYNKKSSPAILGCFGGYFGTGVPKNLYIWN
jgi:hypothetical protein